MIVLLLLGVLSTVTAVIDENSVHKNYLLIDGFKFPGDFDVQRIREALSYRVRDDDLFVVTYPKCGTTWVQTMVTLILNNGTVPRNDLDRTSTFLEYLGLEGVNSMPRPGIIKTHIYSPLQPWNPRARYVIVTRNPKDQFVSYAHHVINIDKFYENATMAEFFELWTMGETLYGSYFDWHLSWLPYLDLPNILFLTYEDIKVDPRSAIHKLAAHVGVSSETVEIHMDQILAKSSVEGMRKILNDEVNFKGFQFVRKGVVGGWKSQLTDHQSAIIDQLFKDNFSGTLYEKLWQKHNFP
ncbi:Sulfotransferase 1C2 [Halotydeus destructor]|nr:Sulfotransferase 1C2 [Halotydeus destructor]